MSQSTILLHMRKGLEHIRDHGFDSDFAAKILSEVDGMTCEDEGCPHYRKRHAHREETAVPLHKQSMRVIYIGENESLKGQTALARPHPDNQDMLQLQFDNRALEPVAGKQYQYNWHDFYKKDLLEIITAYREIKSYES